MTEVSPILDNVSLMSRLSIGDTQWGEHYVERIYQICGQVHPGMAIDHDAVLHVKNTIIRILAEILESRPMRVSELEKNFLRLFPKSCQWIVKEGLETLSHTPRKSHSARFGFSRQHEFHSKMISLVESVVGSRENDKRDRELEKEIERMGFFTQAVCEILTEDILKWTGNYVKHIRSTDPKITLQNLQIAMNADKGLMQLTSCVNNEEEDVFIGGFFSNFCEYNEDIVDSQISMPNVTYESIAHEFLKEERLYLRELNQTNIFVKRLESYLNETDKKLLKQIFGNLQEIHDLTIKVERTLEDSIEMNDGLCIGMGFWELSEAQEFDTYLSYMMRGEDEEQLYNIAVEAGINELLVNSQYAHIFSNDDGGYGNSLEGTTFRLAVRCVLPTLLSAPILHLFRYLDYVNKLLRFYQTEEDRTDLENCKIYLNSVVNKIENQCSHLKSKIKQEQTVRNDSRISQVKKLQNIQYAIDGFEGNPIGQTCNELMKEGSLQMVRPSVAITGDVTKKGRWATDRYIYLFDQLIVFCKKHNKQTSSKASKYKFKTRAAVSRVEVVDLGNNNGLKHSFRLDIREKNLVLSYTMVCKSLEEKSSWLTALVTVTTKGLLDRILDAYQKEDSKRIPLITPSPAQYRYAEADSEENIIFEDYTSSSGVPEIKSGTILKLVERLTYHQYTDNKFAQTFLISYRTFTSPHELLDLLVERFNVPIPLELQNQEMRGGPLAGRYDTIQSHGLTSGKQIPIRIQAQCYQRFTKEYERPIQRRVLAVMQQWVKKHWSDFENDPGLLEKLKEFLQKSCETQGKLTNQHKKFCKSISALIEKLVVKSAGPLENHTSSTAFDWESVATQNSRSNQFQPKKPEIVWHIAKKGEIETYDLLTLHPLEIGRQLTILHFDLHRAIKPSEFVAAAWTKHDKHERSPQLLKLIGHCNLLTYWVSRSIVESDSLEERVAMLSRAVEVMYVFEDLHNFTGIVTFLSALHSSSVNRLRNCFDRLDSDKMKCYERLDNLCDSRYKNLSNRLKDINPPCVPFSGLYMSTIFRFETGNSTFVKNVSDKEKNKKSPAHLVSFYKCRKISDQIREIQMYQDQPYYLQVEPSIRQYFETINPLADFNENEEELQTYLFEKSLKVFPKDGDKTPETNVKSKRPPNVLKSPGTKPPKSNNAQSHHQQAMTVPSTPNPDNDGPKSAFLLSSRDDSQMNLDSHHIRHYSGESSRRTQAPSKIGLLQPPPTYPHKSSRSLPPPIPFAPSTQSYLPKSQPKSPLSAKTPPTPKSANRSIVSDAFIFPSTDSNSAYPVRNHRYSGDGNIVSEQKVVFERPRSAVSHSPTVCLSVPLPPALPPRRVVFPPPLPPKPHRSQTPPPLPPKTYKHKQSSPDLPQQEK
ncbi:unnamed protein product [Auanema sp. JU1783]|nr:unnamed protein product [Auanema sp. JU1783]